ncbi:unnamed protein product [Arabis nemorensis]|uniref:Uncharacterized protein n=1 Tax=Arabis nemorensis TaxID=586526 RepID=A0A565C415_9BRAS|nr:unnamed protein product [Arabis nemorensis]
MDELQAEQLIENLVQSDACYGGDYDRNFPPSDNNSDHKLKELSERLDRMGKVLMANQKEVHFVGEIDSFPGSYQEESAEVSDFLADVKPL